MSPFGQGKRFVKYKLIIHRLCLSAGARDTITARFVSPAQHGPA